MEHALAAYVDAIRQVLAGRVKANTNEVESFERNAIVRVERTDRLPRKQTNFECTNQLLRVVGMDAFRRRRIESLNSRCNDPGRLLCSAGRAARHRGPDLQTIHTAARER